MPRPKNPPSAPYDPADDILDNPIDQQAAIERQAAVLGSSGHTWAGRQLHPFSIRRESLYFRIRAIAAPLPLKVVIANPETFLQDAMIILWLCAHEPADWNPMRGSAEQLLEAVESWAEENIPRALQTDAVALATQIFREGDSTRALPQPSDRQEAEERLGN